MSALVVASSPSLVYLPALPSSISNIAIMANAFQDHDIVPRILPSLPATILGLVYDGHDVQPGTKVPRKNTLQAPTISHSETGEYVIVMIGAYLLDLHIESCSHRIADPDLFKTNDPTGQVRHWVQKVSIGADGNANLGQEVTSYLPCTPGAGSGSHRYIFVLAKMSASRPVEPDFIHSPNEDLKDRMGFYLDKYIESKQLEVVAANFMLVRTRATVFRYQLISLTGFGRCKEHGPEPCSGRRSGRAQSAQQVDDGSM